MTQYLMPGLPAEYAEVESHARLAICNADIEAQPVAAFALLVDAQKSIFALGPTAQINAAELHEALASKFMDLSLHPLIQGTLMAQESSDRSIASLFAMRPSNWPASFRPQMN